MPKKMRLELDLPEGVSEKEVRKHLEGWLQEFSAAKLESAGDVFLMAPPNFGSPEESHRFSALASRLFRQMGLSVELRHRLVITDLITELYATKTNFGLMLVYEPCLAFMARQGLLRPLDEIFPDAERRFHSLGLRKGRDGGHIYSVPLHISCRTLFFRQDLLGKYGIKAPRTFGELEDICSFVLRREKNSRLQGLALDLQSINRFNLSLDFLWSQGEEMFHGGGPWNFNAAAWQRALERMQSLRQYMSPSALQWNASDAAQSFFREEAIFCLNWSDYMRNIHEGGPTLRKKYSWALHPTEELASKRMVRTGGPSVVIPRACQHPMAAEKLLPRFLDPLIQESLLRHPSWPFPAQPGLWNRPKVRQANPYFAEAENFLKDGVLLEERTFVHGNHLHWQNAVNAALEDLRDPAENLKRLESMLTPLLPPRLYKGLVAQALEIIERRSAGPLDVGTLAKELVVSREHFMREFKRQTGTTPLKFIHKKQMEKAREMLEFTHSHVGEVAQKLGYQDLGHFSRLFKKILKKNPSEFKRAGF